MTGAMGADTFLPPGKVADFFGFQYMRDIDLRGAGHNMNFLTDIANSIPYILDDGQRALLTELDGELSFLYSDPIPMPEIDGPDYLFTR